MQSAVVSSSAVLRTLSGYENVSAAGDATRECHIGMAAAIAWTDTFHCRRGAYQVCLHFFHAQCNIAAVVNMLFRVRDRSINGVHVDQKRDPPPSMLRCLVRDNRDLDELREWS